MIARRCCDPAIWIANEKYEKRSVREVISKNSMVTNLLPTF